MKTLSLFLVCTFLAVSASGCTFMGQEEENRASAAPSSQSASGSEEAAPSESISDAPSETVTSDAGAAQAPSQDRAESVSGSAGESSATEGLVRYDSIYDIPFADLEYENDRNSLTLNGEPWASAPGPSKLGDLCFTDGKILIIQCFLGDLGDLTNFVWFAAPFDWNDEAPLFPEETYNKRFTRAEGYTLYTDDGYSYTVTP